MVPPELFHDAVDGKQRMRRHEQIDDHLAVGGFNDRREPDRPTEPEEGGEEGERRRESRSYPDGPQ